jgi:hypothetical protein
MNNSKYYLFIEKMLISWHYRKDYNIEKTANEILTYFLKLLPDNLKEDIKEKLKEEVNICGKCSEAISSIGFNELCPRCYKEEIL